ncbi:hypothetical protein BGZ73_003706 [Actinomortierella ambigua]|nr:hypothetical protein BGZ73_003706 [Actinomortierella ambigua]
MLRRSAIFAAALLSLLVLIQTVAAALPPTGFYRLVNVAENGAVRQSGAGVPLFVPAGGSGTPPSAEEETWRVLWRGTSLYTLQHKQTSLFAQSTSSHVIAQHQQSSNYILRELGNGAYEIVNTSGNLVWTAVVGNARSQILLKPRNGSTLQQFRFVRVQ